jgi:DNA repair protein RecN (Recombination protein N)
VAKHAGRGTTDVVVDVLDEKERIEEIARMLSGDDVTDLARRQAKEFIKSAKENT